MGAHPEDYRRSAPPNSYIHVDDFASPRDLAEYLHKLDTNDNLYNEYFRWKGTGEFIDTKFWCRLCNMVNTVPSYRMWYNTLGEWWTGKGICRRARITGTQQTWATWRNVSRSTSFIDTVRYGQQETLVL
jgi:glycoprotein 3-alpha-L-fucosyltransferase